MNNICKDICPCSVCKVDESECELAKAYKEREAAESERVKGEDD